MVKVLTSSLFGYGFVASPPITIAKVLALSPNGNRNIPIPRSRVG
jgi:hypothetical protein